MRIACVHIPQFALQCATRIDPSLRRGEPHAALVIVGPPPAAAATAVPGQRASMAPIVLGCSRAAWALGARVGMTATAARALSPQLEIVTADPQRERDTVRAVADVLLAVAPVVDVGGRVGPGNAHLALYCEVPAKVRGATFGDRLLQRLEVLGLSGRIGIADDRFTAWVAASSPATGAADAAHHAVGAAPAHARRHDDTGVVSVPRGGSAAFLAPRSLALLSISPEVQHMLEALGVRTLGQFAALPSPTVSSRAARFEADFQALARGESGNTLRPYAPDAPVREEVVVHAAAPHALGLPAAVALLAERVALRLAGRGRGAARLDVTIAGAAGERVTALAPVRDGQGVLATADELADAIGTTIGEGSNQVWRLAVVVTGEALAGDAPDATELAEATAAAHGSLEGTPLAIAPRAPLGADAHGIDHAAQLTDPGAALERFAAGSAAHAAPDVRTSLAAAMRTPAQRSFAIATAHPHPSAGSAAHRRGAAGRTVAAGLDSEHRAGPHTSMTAGEPGAQLPRDADAMRADAEADAIALSVALSTTGSTIDRVFGLTSPVSSTLAAERRAAHRRTRRGKQRRRAEVASSMVQPGLFKL